MALTYVVFPGLFLWGCLSFTCGAALITRAIVRLRHHGRGVGTRRLVLRGLIWLLAGYLLAGYLLAMAHAPGTCCIPTVPPRVAPGGGYLARAGR
jgi:hypothetical protein